MKIFKKDGQPPLTKLEKRAQSLSTFDLVLWVESLLPAIGKSVVHHQRDGVEVLVDAEANAEAVLAITRELKRRMTNG